MLLCTALLMTGCAKEDKTDNGSGGGTSPDTGNVREVLMTLKNQLALQKPTKAGETKADAPIATAAENAISTLDVYVFGSLTETGDYTFQERFAYRANSDDKLPANATELQLNTSGADGKETTGLMKIQKGLFVKLYCIANDTTLFDPAANAIVKDNSFKPLTLDETGTKIIAEGAPQESTFTTWHTRLFTAAAKADTLATPLAMTGSYVTPVDLTNYDNSARVQLSFRLTRLAARFDINNNAAESRFTIESVTMGNARRGSSYFPIRVYGELPKAQPDELITLTPRTLTADGANTGLATGAFYSYPASKEDQAFMVLKGTYKVNETEKKDVSYQIPFKQTGSNGDAMWLDIANNHRYTIAITKANEFHLDANILVADWSDSGVIDYTPDNKPGNLVVTIPPNWNKSEYDADANCVRMSLENNEDNTFTITTTANSALGLNKIYAGGVSGAKYNWLHISEPTTTASGAAGVYQYTYTATLTEPYTLDRYPRVTLRFFSLTDGSETLLFVEPLSVPIPVETEQVSKAPNGISNNPNNFDTALLQANLYRITNSSVRIKNSCPDGVEVESHPDWLTVEEISANTVETVFQLTLNDRDVVVKDNKGTVVFKNKSQDKLKTEVTVTLLDAPVTPDFSSSGAGNIVTPANPDTGTPTDLGILIQENQNATVNINSMDGVRVKINYNGGPEWLSYTGAETATKAAPAALTEQPAQPAQPKTPFAPMAAPKAAATTAGSASLWAASPRATMSKTIQIVFSPVISKLADARMATVTLQNIIGGKDSSFTISPIMQPATVAKGKETPVPVQDMFDGAKKTAVLYQLPGNKDKSQMQIAVSSLGGSALAIEGEGVTVSPAESKANEANYILRPALADGTNKATVTLHAKNYTDKEKKNDYTITVLRSDLTGETKATLKAQLDQTVTFKATSHEGFSIDPNAIVWQPQGESGGAAWFKVPTTDFDKGENKVITLTATTTTATAQVRPATLTLKNKIVNGGDLTVVVTPEYVVPTLSTPTAADPTQNTLTASPTSSIIKLYRVDDSKITFKATAIGGSTITDAKGVTVTGGDTYNTENTFTVTLNKDATAGSFKVVNKSDPTKIHAVTVNAPEATITAANIPSLTVIQGNTTTSAVKSPEGFQASVTWGGGNIWFDLTGGDANNNYPHTASTVGIKVKENIDNALIKTATVTLKNKIRGGANATFSVTPILAAPTATYVAGSSQPTQNTFDGNTTIKLYRVSGSRLSIKATSFGGNIVQGTPNNVTVEKIYGSTSATNSTYAVTLKDGATSGSFVLANSSDDKKKQTFTVTTLDPAMTATNVNLQITPGTYITSATNSPKGYTTKVDWGGGGAWFDLPTSMPEGAQNIKITVKSNINNLSIKKATVTMTNNITGGPVKTFTVTPILGTPVVTRVSALPTGNTPATNNTTLPNNTKLTLYKLPAGETNYVLNATCYGGTKATMVGNGFTISPANIASTSQVTTYIVKATATSGSGTITITNAEGKNGVTIPVDIKNSVMNVTQSVSLMPHHGSLTTKITSDTGYNGVEYNFPSGSKNWFTVTQSLSSGEQTIAIRANSSVLSNQQNATVTLKNRIAGAPNATINVNAAATTTPTITSFTSPSPTQNSGDISGKTITLYYVPNSSISVSINSIGGSYVESNNAGINVTGGNDQETTNTFTLTSTSSAGGNLIIANRADNSKTLTIQVIKKSAAISVASPITVTAANSGTKDITVSAPAGVTARVSNWGGGDQWFNINKSSTTGNDYIQITQTNNTSNLMKEATITLTNKMAGGGDLDIKIKPTNFPAPNIGTTTSATLKNEVDSYNSDKTTVTVAPTIGKYKVKSYDKNVVNISASGNVYTLTASHAGTTDIVFCNESDETKTATFKLTVKVDFDGKPVYVYDNLYFAPELRGPGPWGTGGATAQAKCPSGWRLPTKAEMASWQNYFPDMRERGLLPAGQRWWSSNEASSTNAYCLYIEPDINKTNVGQYNKTNINLYSRCVKNK